MASGDAGHVQERRARPECTPQLVDSVGTLPLPQGARCGRRQWPWSQSCCHCRAVLCLPECPVAGGLSGPLTTPGCLLRGDRGPTQPVSHTVHPLSVWRVPHVRPSWSLGVPCGSRSPHCCLLVDLCAGTWRPVIQTVGGTRPCGSSKHWCVGSHPGD